MSEKNEKQNHDKVEHNKDLPEAECCSKPFACSTV